MVKVPLLGSGYIERLGVSLFNAGIPTLEVEIKLPNAIGSIQTLMESVTVLVAVFITLTLLEIEFATYTVLPSGLMDIPSGKNPTVIVAVIISVAVLITVTFPTVSYWVTYNVLPSALKATQIGLLPTTMVAETLSLAVVITLTVFVP